MHSGKATTKGADNRNYQEPATVESVEDYLEDMWGPSGRNIGMSPEVWTAIRECCIRNIREKQDQGEQLSRGFIYELATSFNNGYQAAKRFKVTT